jgi:hypothetical protein
MDAGTFLSAARAALRPAARAFVGTAVVAALLTLLLAGAAWAIAAEGSFWKGLLAATLALAVGVAAGAALAWKRGLAAAMLHVAAAVPLASAMEERLPLDRVRELGPMGRALAQRITRAPADFVTGKIQDQRRAATRLVGGLALGAALGAAVVLRLAF